MVLSNKKLKQKLRIALEDAKNPQKTMKELLGSVSHKPILTKREKKRKSMPLLQINAENKDAHVEESVIGVKRVREEKGSEEKVDVVVEDNGGGGGGGGEVQVKKIRKKPRWPKAGEDGVEEDNGGDGEVQVKKKRRKERPPKKAVSGEDGGGGEELSKVEKVRGVDNSSGKKKKKVKKWKNKKKKREEEEKEKEDKEKECLDESGGVSEQIVEEISEGNDGDSMKVYVGGMPYSSTEGDIRSYFDHCGTITDIDCMYFPESGKFRGIAIISFETEEAAKSALELDGSDMAGLYLKIQPYKTPRTHKKSEFSPPVIEGYNRIYAGNLPWDITEADLRKFFSDCNISSIRFGEDKETGEFKGYAHVDFADDVSLNKALILDQQFVCGRPVKISRAVPKKAVVGKAGSALTVVQSVKNTGSNSVVPPENNSGSYSVVTPENNSGSYSVVTPENTAGVVSGKIKRRTCYDCGERGHISSDCPKSKTTGHENPIAAVQSGNNTECNSVVTPENDGGFSSVVIPESNNGFTSAVIPERYNGFTSAVIPEKTSSVSSGKLKRRTCYDCGERGHISSDCPKRKTTDQDNPAAG